MKDECALSGGSPCQNNGICVDELGGYRCECTANFTGVNCTEPGSTTLCAISVPI